MLILPIKRKWFDMIKNGEKKEEYREIKPYYTTRFEKLFPYNIYQNEDGVWYLGNRTPAQEIIFRNGYNRNSPFIKCKCELGVGTGREEWGAEPNKKYYILSIMEILEVQNGRNT